MSASSEASSTTSETTAKADYYSGFSLIILTIISITIISKQKRRKA
ncbi:MAG: hypothetical protein ACFFAE_15225 [Candidatus Hodarchaeota archaeon]